MASNISYSGRVALVLTLLKLPFTLLFALLLSPFVEYNKRKSWRRVLNDRAVRSITDLDVAQTQPLARSTLDNYRSTVVKLGLDGLEEDIGEGAHLMWIGQKRTDSVLLYLHGGAFFFPLSPHAIEFWVYIKRQLLKQFDLDMSVVVLEYSLLPEAGFPTPLRQAVAAVNRLFADGVSPESLHIAGDSAGGNLVTQVLLHALRPVPSVPPIRLTKPFRGACTISGMYSLVAETPSNLENSPYDIITQRRIQTWGTQIIAGVPDSQRGYIDPQSAPDAWLDNLERVVDRMLLTAGGRECMRDDIVAFHDRLKKGYRGDLELVIQKDGVHCDMMMDFLARVSQPSELTGMTIRWLAAGNSIPS